MPFDILALNLHAEASEYDGGDLINKKIDIFELNMAVVVQYCA